MLQSFKHYFKLNLFAIVTNKATKKPRDASEEMNPEIIW